MSKTTKHNFKHVLKFLIHVLNVFLVIDYYCRLFTVYLFYIFACSISCNFIFYSLHCFSLPGRTRGQPCFSNSGDHEMASDNLNLKTAFLGPPAGCSLRRLHTKSHV